MRQSKIRAPRLEKGFIGKSVFYGAEGEDRTPDLVITNDALYH